jgi:hypothetical protein
VGLEGGKMRICVLTRREAVSRRPRIARVRYKARSASNSLFQLYPSPPAATTRLMSAMPISRVHRRPLPRLPWLACLADPRHACLAKADLPSRAKPRLPCRSWSVVHARQGDYPARFDAAPLGAITEAGARDGLVWARWAGAAALVHRRAFTAMLRSARRLIRDHTAKAN